MIDQNSIAAYFGNDQSMLRRFATVFVEEAPNLVNRMDESLFAGDWAAFAIYAHTLRGQLGYFGFPELSNHLYNIEHCAEKGDISTLPQHFASFTVSFQAAYFAIADLAADC